MHQRTLAWVGASSSATIITSAGWKHALDPCFMLEAFPSFQKSRAWARTCAQTDSALDTPAASLCELHARKTRKRNIKLIERSSVRPARCLAGRTRWAPCAALVDAKKAKASITVRWAAWLARQGARASRVSPPDGRVRPVCGCKGLWVGRAGQQLRTAALTFLPT